MHINKQFTICAMFLLVVLGRTSVWAQGEVFSETSKERREISTLFNGESEVRGFGAFDMKFTEINDDFAIFLGGHGGLILNKHLILGLGGYGISTRHELTDQALPEDSIRSLNLYGGHGGLIVGYVFQPRKVFHIALPLFIGAGGASISNDRFQNTNSPDIRDRDIRVEESGYFVIEPSVQLELNFASFFRVGLGVSYRYITGNDMRLVSNADLSGLSTEFSLKFGKF